MIGKNVKRIVIGGLLGSAVAGGLLGIIGFPNSVISANGAQALQRTPDQFGGTEKQALQRTPDLVRTSVAWADPIDGRHSTPLSVAWADPIERSLNSAPLSVAVIRPGDLNGIVNFPA